MDLTETGKDDTETAVVIEVKKSTDASGRLGPKRNSNQTTTDLTVKIREKPIDKGRDRLKVTNETNKGKQIIVAAVEKAKKPIMKVPGDILKVTSSNEINGNAKIAIAVGNAQKPTPNVRVTFTL